MIGRGLKTIFVLSILSAIAITLGADTTPTRRRRPTQQVVAEKPAKSSSIERRYWRARRLAEVG